MSRQSPKPSIYTKRKFTQAILSGDQSACGTLLARYPALLNMPTNEPGHLSPLSLAIEREKKDLALYFINKDEISFSVRDEDGWAPIHHAISGTYASTLVPALLEKDQAQANFLTRTGDTALMIAADRDKQGTALDNLLSARNIGLSKRNIEGFAAIHIAAMNGYLDFLKALVERVPTEGSGEEKSAVDVNCLSRGERTPLMMAARGEEPCIYREEDKLAVMQYLIAHGASIRRRDEDGLTALHYAAMKGHLTLVEFLLAEEKKPIVKSNNPAARRPSMLRKKQREMIPSKHPNNDKYLPIHLAAEGGHQAVVDVLIQHDSEQLRAMTDYGVTPLSLALANGHTTLARNLFSQLPDPSVDEVKSLDGLLSEDEVLSAGEKRRKIFSDDNASGNEATDEAEARTSGYVGLQAKVDARSLCPRLKSMPKTHGLSALTEEEVEVEEPVALVRTAKTRRQKSLSERIDEVSAKPLTQADQEVIGIDIKRYASRWKVWTLGPWGHHHDARARAMIRAIKQKGMTRADAKRLLLNQLGLFSTHKVGALPSNELQITTDKLPARWNSQLRNRPSFYKNKKGGYQKAIENALGKLNSRLKTAAATAA